MDFLTLTVGLTASVIGGVVAGWLILKTNGHDLKCVYARHMYVDFGVFSSLAFMDIYNLTSQILPEILNNISSEIKETRKKELDGLWKYVADLSDESFENKIELSSREKIIKMVPLLLSHSEHGFNEFFAKFPVQVSYFDRFYVIHSLVNTERRFRQTFSINDDTLQLVYKTRIALIHLLMLAYQLKVALDEIGYYQRARVWSWNIFRRNFD